MPTLRARAVSTAAIAVLFAAAACSDGDESVFNAEVGECVESLSDLTGNITELPESDCSEDHEAEIFFLVEHEGDDDDYPGETALQEEAADECEDDNFEDYTGVPLAETSIRVAYITPSPESWEEGDRESICVLAIPGESVDVSFEDNGEDFEGGFASLIEDCEGGDNAVCDELYRQTPVDSPEEEIGATCGGRSDEPLNGSCEATLG